MPRYAARVDANHSQLVAAARKLGFRVLDLSRVGQGCPDLLLQHPRTHQLLLAEVKVPTGKINALQAAFGTEWPVHIVRTVDDLLKLLK